MSLLPEIDENGQLILSKDEKKFVNLAYHQRKTKLKELIKGSEERIMTELNNLGHAEVTLDFEDSPFADRQPIEDEEE